MAERSSNDAGPSDEYSLRSRASSIISTGTKTSIGTFLTTPFNPQSLPPSAPIDEPRPSNTSSNVIDVLLGRRNFRISARPGSILSISSYDVPAPPYSEAINTPAVPVESIQGLIGQPLSTPQRNRDLAETQILSPTPRPTRPRVQIRPSTADTDATATGTEVTESFDDSDGRSTNATSSPPSPPLSPLESSQNQISAHYTNIVRTIDSNHRTEVARLEANHQAQLSALRTAHEAEIEELESKQHSDLEAQRAELESNNQSALAATRNEIDAVYRGEFARMRQENHELQASSEAVKALKDQALAKAVELNGHLTAMEKEIEELKADKQRLEKAADDRERNARNETEDMWEKRWLQRMQLARDQVSKMDKEMTFVYEEVESRSPGMSDEVREAAKERVKSEETPKAKKGKKWSFSQA